MTNKYWLLPALCLLALFPELAHADSPANYIWIEGEAPASVTPGSIKPAIENVGRPQYLSGGNWLHINIESSDAAKQMPAEGIVLTYNVNAPKAGDYALWNRIGYELVRSPFEWRVDN